MPKAPRENRIPIMMSDDEVKGVDDWRYSNRVATRSDAIRRLCQIGLTFDADAKRIEKSSERAIRVLFHAVDKLRKQDRSKPQDPQVSRAYLTIAAALESQMDLHRELAKLFVSKAAFSARETELDHALEIIAGLRNLVDQEKET